MAKTWEHPKCSKEGNDEQNDIPFSNYLDYFLKAKKKKKKKSDSSTLGHARRPQPSLPAWEGFQKLPGARKVSVATYIVHGIHVTVGVDEEPDQGREVVPHSEVQRRGTLLWKEIHGSIDQSLPGLPSCRLVLGTGGGKSIVLLGLALLASWMTWVALGNYGPKA